jgi:hypothetical protein
MLGVGLFARERPVDPSIDPRSRVIVNSSSTRRASFLTGPAPGSDIIEHLLPVCRVAGLTPSGEPRREHSAVFQITMRWRHSSAEVFSPLTIVLDAGMTRVGAAHASD